MQPYIGHLLARRVVVTGHLHRSQLALVCSAWDRLTKPDSTAWETVNVTLRPKVQGFGRSAAVDGTPFLEWLARRIGVLRRVQILTRNHLEGVRCLSTSSHGLSSALRIPLFNQICRAETETPGDSVTT